LTSLVVASAWRRRTEASVRGLVRVLPLATQPTFNNYADHGTLSNDRRAAPCTALGRRQAGWKNAHGGL